MKGKRCGTCGQTEHHDPRCPEMFWPGPDGKPDFSHLRGTIHPEAVKPLGPLRLPPGYGDRR